MTDALEEAVALADELGRLCDGHSYAVIMGAFATLLHTQVDLGTMPREGTIDILQQLIDNLRSPNQSH